MKKEAIIAIIIGFAIGLALTFFLYKNRLSKTEKKIVSPVAEEKNLPTSEPSVSQVLSIISPIDQSISKEGKTIVSGVTSPSSWVVILGEKGEKTVQADSKGNFETDLLLVSGENEIEINSMEENGDVITKTVTVVYSTAEI